MSRPKTIMVDLDGVICTEERTFERPLAEPMPGAREALQRLRDAGHSIVIYTARGWAELRVAKQWVGGSIGEGIEDLTVDNDRPIRETALEIVGWLGWRGRLSVGPGACP